VRTFVQWLRLVRLPLAFTAVGDAWAVRWLGHDLAESASPLVMPPPRQLALLAGISLCLYALGMVLNDVMDARRDPAGKPIPSGEIRPAAAALFAAALAGGAIGLAWLYGRPCLDIAIIAGLLIVAYDTGLKRFPICGLLLLGAIRAVHCQISGVATAAVNAPLWVSLFLFTHVTVVSWIAYGWEDKRPRIRTAARWGLAAAVVAVDFALIDLFGLWRVWAAPLATMPVAAIPARRFLAIPLAAGAAYGVILFWILFSVRFPGGPAKGRMAMRLGLIWLLVYDAAFLASAGRWAGVIAMAVLLALLMLTSRLLIQLQIRVGLITPAGLARSPGADDLGGQEGPGQA